jgi:hypothetical protein
LRFHGFTARDNKASRSSAAMPTPLDYQTPTQRAKVPWTRIVLTIAGALLGLAAILVLLVYVYLRLVAHGD